MGKTKELFMQIREQIDRETDKVLDGEINAFEVGRELSYTKNCIEGNKERIAQAERNEFEKYTKEELLAMKIRMAGGGYTWNFKHIPEWVKKNEELKAIEEAAKQAFKAKIDNKTVFSNDDGGEIIPAEATPRKQSISYQ